MNQNFQTYFYEGNLPCSKNKHNSNIQLEFNSENTANSNKLLNFSSKINFCQIQSNQKKTYVNSQNEFNTNTEHHKSQKRKKPDFNKKFGNKISYFDPDHTAQNQHVHIQGNFGQNGHYGMMMKQSVINQKNGYKPVFNSNGANFQGNLNDFENLESQKFSKFYQNSRKNFSNFQGVYGDFSQLSTNGSSIQEFDARGSCYEGFLPKGDSIKGSSIEEFQKCSENYFDARLENFHDGQGFFDGKSNYSKKTRFYSFENPDPCQNMSKRNYPSKNSIFNVNKNSNSKNEKKKIERYHQQQENFSNQKSNNPKNFSRNFNFAHNFIEKKKSTSPEFHQPNEANSVEYNLNQEQRTSIGEKDKKMKQPKKKIKVMKMTRKKLNRIKKRKMKEIGIGFEKNENLKKKFFSKEEALNPKNNYEVCRILKINWFDGTYDSKGLTAMRLRAETSEVIDLGHKCLDNIRFN